MGRHLETAVQLELKKTLDFMKYASPPLVKHGWLENGMSIRMFDSRRVNPTTKHYK
jgi:hypothetical protein